jgi:SpoU rRNA Methylase family
MVSTPSACPRQPCCPADRIGREFTAGGDSGLTKILERWFSAVRSETMSRSAISRLEAVLAQGGDLAFAGCQVGFVATGRSVALELSRRRRAVVRRAELALLHASKSRSWRSHPAGNKSVRDLAVPNRLAIVLRAEGHGLDDRTDAAATNLVRIPISSGVESINRGHAAAIHTPSRTTAREPGEGSGRSRPRLVNGGRIQPVRVRLPGFIVYG